MLNHYFCSIGLASNHIPIVNTIVTKTNTVSSTINITCYNPFNS